MKRTNYFIPTLKEKPSDIEQIDQVFMFRAGMLKKVSNGFFVYLPLMQRVMNKVAGIIKQELQAVNSQECKFPILTSQETLEASGRWNAFGKEMFKLSDRSGNGFAISPTNEETACFIAEAYAKSYKDLPFSVYQIQSKHRDEISPRNGVMRAREFTMKDAYSFHADEKCLDNYYAKMRAAYFRIFNRLGLEVVAVSADTGAMGGSASEEIMAISSSGDTDIARCTACDYAANAETVEINSVGVKNVSKGEAFDAVANKIHTPSIKTMGNLLKFFSGKQESDFCKSVVYDADGKLVLALVRGDREVNEIKLRKQIAIAFKKPVVSLEIADPKKLVKKGIAVGFVGPIGISKNIKFIFADNELNDISKNWIVGANEKDHHYTNAFSYCFDKSVVYTDIRYAKVGDTCPKCSKAKLEFTKATELGHIFALGTRYTNKLNMKFTNESGVLSSNMQMGCYGIGVERTIAAVVEQHRDDKGICWPTQVAPFAVHLVTVDITNELQAKVSEQLYNSLTKQGIEVLWDDTEARAGSKFADSELIGFPFRVVVGRGVVDEKVEFVERKGNVKKEILVKDIVAEIVDKRR